MFTYIITFDRQNRELWEEEPMTQKIRCLKTQLGSGCWRPRSSHLGPEPWVFPPHLLFSLTLALPSEHLKSQGPGTNLPR